MKRFPAACGLALIILGSLSGPGCNQSPLPGVEVANPDIDGDTVRIVPKAINETYELRLLDEMTASVDQWSAAENGDEADLLDSVIVPYSRTGSSIALMASFSNARRIAVTATFDPVDGSVDGVLSVDGFQAPACFEVPGLSPACELSETVQDLDDAPPLPPTAHFLAGQPALVEQEPEESDVTENTLVNCQIPQTDEETGEVTFVPCGTPTPENDGDSGYNGPTISLSHAPGVVPIAKPRVMLPPAPDRFSIPTMYLPPSDDEDENQGQP